MQAAYLILAEKVRAYGVNKAARQMDVHRTTVSRWCSGEQEITLNDAERLAAIVGARVVVMDRDIMVIR